VDQGPRSYWAEFVGTFTLCFAGQGAICAAAMGVAPGAGLLGIAVAHGLALAIMITALGTTSGAHFNPAVTFGFVITGRQSVASGIGYWVSQLAGAIVASFLLAAVVPASVAQATHLGAAARAADVSVGGAFVIELVLTFFLVTAVWGTAVDPRCAKVGGFAIGLTVTMDILMGGPLTGAAMNPARAFGPALASGAWREHWLWWAAPLAGGGLAALAYERFIGMPRSPQS
jgi:MIP family channel proteins